MLKNIILLCLTLLSTTETASKNHWEGKWFPHSPNAEDTNPVVISQRYNLADPNHGVLMGVIDSSCDDANTNLAMDWFMNPDNYTCLENRKLYLPNSYTHPVHTIEHVPRSYMAPHICMSSPIQYTQTIPTFGPHRPLWPVYGEYQFLPRQRWLHSLEHGAVVMLYHPCAERNEVNLLKSIVKNCLHRYVITPYNLLERTRPIVLVTWGHRLEMSRVAKDVAVKFIKDHALQGPEQISRDGQYTLMLQEKAKIVSDNQDSILCPVDVENSITMK